MIITDEGEELTDNGVESEVTKLGLQEETSSDKASRSGVVSNRRKRVYRRQGNQERKRVHIVNTKTSTLPWTEVKAEEDFESFRFNFIGEPQGPAQILPPNVTPLDVVSKFFDDEIISLLVEETNR